MINSISSVTDSSLLQQIQPANQNQDSNFGSFMIAQLNKDFDKIDTDGDGKITKKELKAFLTQMAQKNPQAGQAPNVDDMVNAIFSKLDSNKTGSIDKSTIAAALQKMADSLFDKMDTNHDGKVDPAELKAFLSKMQKNHRKAQTDQGPSVDDMVNQIFSKLDPDKTGSISKSSSLDLFKALMPGR